MSRLRGEAERAAVFPDKPAELTMRRSVPLPHRRKVRLPAQSALW